MDRRTLLAATASSVVLVGCLDGGGVPGGEDADGTDSSGENASDGTGDGNKSDDDGDSRERTFEECDRPIIWYRALPDPVAEEVDVAFEDGSYDTTDDLYYDQAVDVDETWLSKDGKYYRASVEPVDDGDTTSLVFVPDTPVKSTTQELWIYNGTDETLDVVATVTDDDGDIVVDESLEGLEPGGDYDDAVVPVTREYGEYEVTIEYPDGDTYTATWTIRYVETDARVELDEDGISVGPMDVMDPPPCPWE